MSTKSTIFLTADNEHCYFEHALPHYNENKEWTGDTIVLEMSKKHTSLVINDDEDIIVEIKPDNELHKVFKDLSQKPFYEVVKLLSDLEKWEQINHIDEDLLQRIKSLKDKLQFYI